MTARTQFIRYVVVGLASNAVIYVAYIVLTQLGMGPKLAMSLLYCVGVFQTFVFNKKWSFRFAGASTPALVRYLMVYAVGYAVNLLALMLLVDQAELPHQIVQGMMIIVVAIMLFFAQRYWVFRQPIKSDMA
jgi:putative flippase GtrA